MSAWDAIRTKRAIREFADRPIPPELLDRIVRACVIAPVALC